MRRVILTLSVAFLCCAPGVMGQTDVVLDEVTNIQDDSLLVAGLDHYFRLRYRNYAVDHYNINNGYRIFSPDGAEWSYPARETVIDTIIPGDPPVLTNTFIDSVLVADPFLPAFFNVTLSRTYFSPDGQGGDTVGFAGAANLAVLGLVSGYDKIAFEIPIRSRVEDHRKHICIDSSWFPPGGTWKWAPLNIANPQIAPDWSGQQCFKVVDPNAPQSELTVSPDTLSFAAIQGGDSPPSQQFLVDAVDGPISFSVFEDASWILKDISGGTTPQNVTISVNITGLTEGTLFDSVRVESGDAFNSPQFVYIQLEIGPPPPEIAVSQSAFFFNAIAGESNPPVQTLTITNAGGSALNWSVSNSEAWLQLAPPTGVDSGDVTLSVDITGLPFNDFHDTIVVSDINATNDPVRIPVTLSVASDLPIIEVDYKPLYVVASSELDVFDRGFVVRNVAGGTMNYTVQESSTRIIGIDIHSGVADDSVTLTYRIKSASEGQQYLDTVWVYSNEAINSPVPVPMLIRIVSEPAILEVDKDTVYLNAFECWQGLSGAVPVDEFYVSNVGGDDPIEVDFEFESDNFTMVWEPPVVLPQPFTVQAPIPTVKPQGVYLDTILVLADRAINSPETLIVKYTVMPPAEDPEILLGRTVDSAIWKMGMPGFDMPSFTIHNIHGGCMDWFADTDAPWLTPIDSSGSAPGTAAYAITPFGETIGIYDDSVLYHVPDASNSPQAMSVRLYVYERRGDVNADGLIDIGDITDLIKYLYLSGPEPYPLLWIGDVNCDGLVDIGDLTDLITYLYEQGNPPCDDLIEWPSVAQRQSVDP
jgi:hypothetical protein